MMVVSSKEIKDELTGITESIARDQFSDMIGDKIIGKIFSDNLSEYESQHGQDMEPILNLCSIITRVLYIV